MAEDSSLKELRRQVDHDPGSEVFAELAEALRRNGELAEAIRVAQEGLVLNPGHHSAQVTLGQALLDFGDPAGARSELEAVLRNAPNDVLARRLLGQCLEALGDEDAALRHYRAASEAGPPDAETDRRIHRLEERVWAASIEPITSARRDILTRPAADDSRRPIDYVDFADEGVVAPSKVPPVISNLQDPKSATGEALRFLGAKVQDLRHEAGVRCLALTSALPGEGKSTLALSLAGAAARETDQRVLLIEADLRRPSITSTLGIPQAEGLSEWLESRIDEVPIRLVEPGGFSLLVAGQGGLARPELLGSPRMDALLRAARTFFDFIVIDGIPVLPVTDAVLLQDLVDGFLLVVRSRQTPRAAIRDTLARLRPEKIKGVVLNDHREYRDSYRTAAYQRYGMGTTGAHPGKERA